LIDLFNKLSKGQINSFSHVIIETTGLADPVPIIHTLMTSIDLIRIYVLDGVITVVDAKNGEDTLNMQQESVKQIALAESIIISKIDLVNTTKKNLLIDQLKAINPSAKIFAGSYGNVNLSELFGFNAYDPYRKSKDVKEWLSAEKIEESNHHHHHNIDVNRHDENIEAFSLVSKKPVNMMAFGLFRDLLTAKMGSDLLRVKGIINIKDRDFPAVIHGVQHVFHPVQWLDEWPDRERETKLVFITRNIKKEEIEGLFNALMGLIDSKGLPGVVELI
jgi:G3E family GTPase